MRTRYYSPDLKRFMNCDILTGSIANPSTLNLFAYVNGDPISYVDPFGMSAERGDSGYEISWDSVLFGVHTVLDVVGFVPAVGMIADAANALVYGLEGDWLNFGLSATAIIPVVGDAAAGGKVVSKGAKLLGAATDTARIVENADDIYDTTKVVVEASGTAKKLHRPYIRKATREAVIDATPRLPDGRFIDVNTGLPIDGKYDLGHVYGHEFWRERDLAMEKGWTQKQFNDYMNNPSFYRIEDPISNRSHKFEMR